MWYIKLSFCTFLYIQSMTESARSNDVVQQIFVQDYFSLKHINSINIATCSKNETLNFYKSFKIGKYERTPSTIKILNRRKSGWTDMAMKGSNYNKIGIYVNLDCDLDEQFKADFEKFSSTNYVWLFWSDNYTHGVELLYNLPLRWGSQVTLANGDISLYDIYNFNPTTKVKVTKYAHWNLTHRFSRFSTVAKNNLDGIFIKAFLSLHTNQSVTTIEKVLRMKSSSPEDNMLKFSYTVHDFLRKLYNFSWQFVLSNPSETDIVYEITNNTLTYYNGGQFRALKNKEVDIGLYPAEQLSSGINKIDILPSLTKFRQCFIFMHPRLFTKPGDLLVPFSGPVWLAFVFVLAACAVCLRLASYIINENDEDNEPSTVINFLLVIGSVSQQGLTVTSNRIAKQVAHFSLLILSILAYGFYNAALVILLLSPTPRSINSIDKLMKSHLQLAVEDTAYNRFHISNNYSSIGGELYENKIKEIPQRKEQFSNLSHGIEMIKKSSFAFFGLNSNMYGMIRDDYSDTERCSLAEVLVHRPFDVSSFIRKDLSYKELFVRGLLLLKQTGITSRENKYWNAVKPACLGQEDYIIVNLKSAYLAYIIYFTGFISSLIILSLEKGYEHWRKRPNSVKVIKIQ